MDEGIFLFLPDGFLFVAETRFWLTGTFPPEWEYRRPGRVLKGAEKGRKGADTGWNGEENGIAQWCGALRIRKVCRKPREVFEKDGGLFRLLC